MRVDFYLLTADPAPSACALLARKTIEAGERLLLVAEHSEMLQAVSAQLWQSAPEQFLANGMAGGEHDARQPILLSDKVEAVNDAKFLLLADGKWRDPGDSFTRVLYVFDDDNRAGARTVWKELEGAEGVERKFWKQQSGRWVEGP